MTIDLFQFSRTYFIPFEKKVVKGPLLDRGDPILFVRYFRSPFSSSILQETHITSQNVEQFDSCYFYLFLVASPSTTTKIHRTMLSCFPSQVTSSISIPLPCYLIQCLIVFLPKVSLSQAERSLYLSTNSNVLFVHCTRYIVSTFWQSLLNLCILP